MTKTNESYCFAYRTKIICVEKIETNFERWLTMIHSYCTTNFNSPNKIYHCYLLNRERKKL